MMLKTWDAKWSVITPVNTIRSTRVCSPVPSVAEPWARRFVPHTKYTSCISHVLFFRRSALWIKLCIPTHHSSPRLPAPDHRTFPNPMYQQPQSTSIQQTTKQTRNHNGPTVGALNTESPQRTFSTTIKRVNWSRNRRLSYGFAP